MKISSHRRLVNPGLAALAAGTVAVLLACGGGGNGEAPAAGSAPAAAAPAASGPAADAIDFSTCGGFDAAAAAAIFGAPAAEYAAKRSEQSWGTDCSFASEGDVMREQAVSFTLSRADSAAEAAGDMARLADNAGVADQALDTEGVSHRVSGLGDEALWVAANGSLYVRSGAVTVLVTEPKDEAKQVAVARVILGG